MNKEQKVMWGIAGAVGFCITLIWLVGLLQGLENKSLDARFQLRGPAAHADNIAIVVIDEESIKKLGRWPWRRDVHGNMVRILKAAGAKAVLFDVLFTEEDREHLSADRRLGAAVKRAGNVVLGAFFQKISESGVPTDLMMPVPAINAGTVGFVNFYAETDGLMRKAPLVEPSENGLVPSLALAGIAAAAGTTPQAIIAQKKIRMNDYNEILVNYAGGYETFPYYPYHAVLDGTVKPDQFRDKLVLIGGTATSLFDLKAISFSQIFPGVEIHANVISNILRNDYLRPWPLWMTFILILLGALLPAVVIKQFSPLRAGLMTAGLLCGYCIFIYFLFSRWYVYAECAAPMLSLSLSYVGILLYRFMTVDKEKRWIKKTFSNYLSARVMENILANPAELKLGGKREMLTVLFSDIRGFTTISESLSPEGVVDMLNDYLSAMVDVVFRHDGTLDKFIGDAVMVFWGAPVAQKDHARRAVLCALDMMDELKKLQDKWKAEGKTIIDIGIGINTGEMIVGNMGSKEKMEYTVIGDNVNLASRLEGLNKEYKTHIIISAVTYGLVKDAVEAKPLGAVTVKGKAKAVDIYEVIGRKA